LNLKTAAKIKCLLIKKKIFIIIINKFNKINKLDKNNKVDSNLKSNILPNPGNKNKSQIIIETDIIIQNQNLAPIFENVISKKIKNTDKNRPVRSPLRGGRKGVIQETKNNQTLRPLLSAGEERSGSLITLVSKKSNKKSLPYKSFILKSLLFLRLYAAEQSKLNKIIKEINTTAPQRFAFIKGQNNQIQSPAKLASSFKKGPGNRLPSLASLSSEGEGEGEANLNLTAAEQSKKSNLSQYGEGSNAVIKIFKENPTKLQNVTNLENLNQNKAVSQASQLENLDAAEQSYSNLNNKSINIQPKNPDVPKGINKRASEINITSPSLLVPSYDPANRPSEATSRRRPMNNMSQGYEEGDSLAAEILRNGAGDKLINLEMENVGSDYAIPNLKKFLKTITNFNSELASSQNIIYQFNKSQKKAITNKNQNVFTLLQSSFLTMSSLISKPIFVITSSKVILHLFIYLNKNKYKKNKQSFTFYDNSAGPLDPPRYAAEGDIKSKFLKINKTKLQKICKYISLFYKKPVELELNRLYYPYFDSNILSNMIGLISKIIKFRFIIKKLFFVCNLKKPNKLFSLNAKQGNYTLLSSPNLRPSFLSGLKIKLAGRLLKQKIIPRFTVKKIQRGTLARSKANFVNTARFTNKNKRGAYSITVTLGHIFF
jgi:Mitochondrial ribosomal protein (VAR1)